MKANGSRKHRDIDEAVHICTFCPVARAPSSIVYKWTMRSNLSKFKWVFAEAALLFFPDEPVPVVRQKPRRLSTHLNSGAAKKWQVFTPSKRLRCPTSDFFSESTPWAYNQPGSTYKVTGDFLTPSRLFPEKTWFTRHCICHCRKYRKWGFGIGVYLLHLQIRITKQRW